MTTILVNIHFIVAKLNNYIKNNKHKTGFIPIQEQIVIFRPATPSTTLPTHDTKNSRYLSPQGLSGQKRSATEALLSP